MNDKVIEVLRTQAWERAKGELNAMMQASYLPEHARGNEEWQAHRQKWTDMRKIIDKFIEDMEDRL